MPEGYSYWVFHSRCTNGTFHRLQRIVIQSVAGHQLNPQRVEHLYDRSLPRSWMRLLDCPVKYWRPVSEEFAFSVGFVKYS